MMVFSILDKFHWITCIPNRSTLTIIMHNYYVSVSLLFYFTKAWADQEKNLGGTSQIYIGGIKVAQLNIDFYFNYS